MTPKTKTIDLRKSILNKRKPYKGKFPYETAKYWKEKKAECDECIKELNRKIMIQDRFITDLIKRLEKYEPTKYDYEN